MTRHRSKRCQALENLRATTRVISLQRWRCYGYKQVGHIGLSYAKGHKPVRCSSREFITAGEEEPISEVLQQWRYLAPCLSVF